MTCTCCRKEAAAEQVHRAVDLLNTALQDAAKLGLHVDIKQIDITSMDDPVRVFTLNAVVKEEKHYGRP